MWNSSCAHCHRVLMKEHLNETLNCECGWTWGDGSVPERRSCERQRPPDLRLSDHASAFN